MMMDNNSVDGRESEDSTSESLNYDGQLLANKQNKFSQLSNPSAEPVLLYLSKRKGKVIRKSSTRSVTLYNANKKIRELIRKLEYNPSIEEQVVVMVQKALEIGGLSAKKLEAIVASALYLVHRLNHSQIFLSQITKVYGIRSADVSKCLSIFKKLGLYQEVDILPLWNIYVQLVDYWFPYIPTGPEVWSQAPSATSDAKKSELEFAIDPNKSTIGCAGPPEHEGAITRKTNLREEMLEVGKLLAELPEIDLAKQGKLPQTFAAGIFMISAKYCHVSIQQREVAKRLNICTSTVAQSKRGIMEILVKKAMGNKMDEGYSEKGKAADNKWGRVVGLITSLKAATKG